MAFRVGVIEEASALLQRAIGIERNALEALATAIV